MTAKDKPVSKPASDEYRSNYDKIFGGKKVKKLTLEQSVILSGFTGILMCEFNVFHGEVEKRLGRPVWTHEMGSPEVWEEIKAAFADDFKEMMP